ncbi:PAS domain-containing protein [Sphingomonas changnyeongensis]|uniref:histidine kinase n=1 Tax=Sphingomonas changnyeongensis TaxID=2698679 RepID=A0A7Z2NUK4_9SPHN|nr:PAS domain-containing protein [Sphingomonas changnyeongensis]QHL89837.1 PAS domain-containing protein [Sphingomonas changnyeongensis]
MTEAAEDPERERLRLALEVGRLATWDWELDSGHVVWNDEHYRMQGYAVGEVAPSFAAWAARVHPDDLDAVVAAIEAARDSRTDYRRTFRNLLPGDVVRWASARGRFFYAADGKPLRMIGVMEDVTEARLAQEALADRERRLRALVAELRDRVRNTLARIRAIVRSTAGAAGSVEDLTARLIGRVEAVSRIQSAVTRDPSAGVDLAGLIRDELLAHALRDGPVMTVRGPDLLLAVPVAEMMSLAVHELTANAVAHGALGKDDGRLDLGWDIDGDGHFHLRWREYGSVAPPAPSEGFGLDLLLRTLPRDLGMTTRLAFEPHGISFDLEGPAARLTMPTDTQAATARG